ncbi:Rgg family transcriptional regulator [Vagococcus teuberi]
MESDYGKVVRDIRLNKGYSQKYLYSGIVSKTYAIEFEKGLHDMSVTKFMDVLARLEMGYKEFKFIANNYQSPEEVTSDALVAIAANRGDIETLRKLRAYYDTLKTKEDEVLKARLNLLIYAYEESGKKHIEPAVYKKEDVEILKNYLVSIDSWTISESNFFLNNGHYFDYDTYRFLTESALKQLERYNTFQEAIKVKSFLFCNFLSVAIENQDWNSLKKYRESFFDVTKDRGEGFQQRTLCVLTYSLYDYVMTKDQTFLTNAKKIEEMCYLLGGDYHRLAKGMTDTIEFCENIVSNQLNN